MVYRIEVSCREQVRDVAGEKLKKRIKADFGIDVAAAHVADVYTIDADLGPDVVDVLRSDAFVDPVTQQGLTNAPTFIDADWVIEVGFKPGVTDNVGRTAKEVIEAIAGAPLKDGEGAYTSKMYFLKGPLSKEDIVTIAEGALANTLINRYAYKTMDQYRGDNGMGVYVPRVSIATKPVVETIDINMDIESLIHLNSELT